MSYSHRLFHRSQLKPFVSEHAPDGACVHRTEVFDDLIVDFRGVEMLLQRIVLLAHCKYLSQFDPSISRTTRLKC